MTLKAFVKRYYNGITNLEVICIADSIKRRQWNDFRHSALDKWVLRIVSIFLKEY